MTNLLTTALLIVTIHFSASQAIADMYEWVDENGVTHFSDVPSSSNQNVETIEMSNYPEQGSSPATAEPEISSRPTPKKVPQRKTDKKKVVKRKHTDKVEIYTTSWCGYCRQAIAFLRSNRIKFDQYDIEKDLKAAAAMKALGGTGGVPFAIINGKPILGFSTDAYKQALDLP